MVRAETRDDASAGGLRDIIRGIVALGKLQTSAHPELQTLFQSFQLGGAGNTVALSFDVPASLLDVLGPMAAQHLADQHAAH